jgi:predicted ATPase/DNA-binding CsgD family transcriptional regulator
VADDLAERDEALTTLARLLEAARGGEGRVALVSGEAGIGKTALARHFALAPRAAPLRIFWGACEPSPVRRELAPLRDLAWTQGGGLLERLRSGAAPEELSHALLDELRRPPPALVVFEDLQWADPASLDLLRFLGRRAHQTSALLVFTWRDDEAAAGHPLRTVLGDLPAATRIPLRGLSEGAVAALASRAGRSAGELHWFTKGNPFYLTEILANPSSPVPDTIRDALLARISRLSAAARALLELASLAPPRLELSALAKAAGESFQALDELIDRGFLSAEGGAAFRHEIVRRTVEATLRNDRSAALRERLQAAQRNGHAELTPRQFEVLRALARGLSNAQIGRKLAVSAKTVDHHVSAILAKLQVASRGAAVAEAYRLGLLTGQDAAGRG